VDSTRADGQLMQSPRGWAPLQWMAWQKEAKSLACISHSYYVTGSERDFGESFSTGFVQQALSDASESLYGARR